MFIKLRLPKLSGEETLLRVLDDAFPWSDSESHHLTKELDYLLVGLILGSDSKEKPHRLVTSRGSPMADSSPACRPLDRLPLDILQAIGEYLAPPHTPTWQSLYNFTACGRLCADATLRWRARDICFDLTSPLVLGVQISRWKHLLKGRPGLARTITLRNESLALRADNPLRTHVPRDGVEPAYAFPLETVFQSIADFIRPLKKLVDVYFEVYTGFPRCLLAAIESMPQPGLPRLHVRNLGLAPGTKWRAGRLEGLPQSESSLLSSSRLHAIGIAAPNPFLIQSPFLEPDLGQHIMQLNQSIRHVRVSYAVGQPPYAPTPDCNCSASLEECSQDLARPGLGIREIKTLALNMSSLEQPRLATVTSSMNCLSAWSSSVDFSKLVMLDVTGNVGDANILHHLLEKAQTGQLSSLRTLRLCFDLSTFVSSDLPRVYLKSLLEAAPGVTELGLNSYLPLEIFLDALYAIPSLEVLSFPPQSAKPNVCIMTAMPLLTRLSTAHMEIDRRGSAPSEEAVYDMLGKMPTLKSITLIWRHIMIPNIPPTLERPQLELEDCSRDPRAFAEYLQETASDKALCCSIFERIISGSAGHRLTTLALRPHHLWLLYPDPDLAMLRAWICSPRKVFREGSHIDSTFWVIGPGGALPDRRAISDLLKRKDALKEAWRIFTGDEGPAIGQWEPNLDSWTATPLRP